MIAKEDVKAFFKKVRKGEDEDACWVWLGTRTGKDSRYGVFTTHRGQKYLAHIMSWRIHFSEVPEHMRILRRCKNSLCVKPGHMELGTYVNASKCNKTLEQRFWEKVQKGPLCWEWIGAKISTGYGHIHMDHKNYLAHRIAWMLQHGEMPPDDMHVLHKCDNPACVNPDHLFLGTDKDNHRDKMRKGRGVNPVGEQHGKSKLKVEQVRQIKKDLPFKTMAQIAREQGVHPNTIHAIAKGVTWRHV